MKTSDTSLTAKPTRRPHLEVGDLLLAGGHVLEQRPVRAIKSASVPGAATGETVAPSTKEIP